MVEWLHSLSISSYIAVSYRQMILIMAKEFRFRFILVITNPGFYKPPLSCENLSGKVVKLQSCKTVNEFYE